MRIRSILWALALFALVLTGCAGDDDPTSTPPAATVADDGSASATTATEATPTQNTGVEQTTTPEASPASTENPTEAPEASNPADLDSLTVELQEVTGGLDTPTKVVSAYDGSGRLFVVEKGGTISIVQNGDVLADPFLDITDRVGSGGAEQGLLGLAFHPDFPRTNLLFFNYTDKDGNTVVSRFTVDADAASVDPTSEAVILTQEQPAANHNGGNLLFGPDGYLYIGMGDGGGGGDRYGNAQNGETLLGALLRIDIDNGEPYSIPANNPFVNDDSVRDEIWAMGLRNPWRYSFDRETGDLYIADVGQNQFEEVNVQPADSAGGENYGWPIMEASHCYEAEDCDQTGLALPVTEYPHDDGCSITGGAVYRGQEFPQMAGVYFFSDYCSGMLWGLTHSDGEWQTRLLLETGYKVSSFGQDEAGELYLIDMSSGTLYHLTAT